MANEYIIDVKDFVERIIKVISEPKEWVWYEDESYIELCGVLGGRNVKALFEKEDAEKTIAFKNSILISHCSE